MTLSLQIVKGHCPLECLKGQVLQENKVSATVGVTRPASGSDKTQAGRLGMSDLHILSEMAVLVPVACLSHFRHF